jgi:hypothetical protein
MRIIRTALLSLCVISCALSSLAQEKHWRGNIPFNFTIKNQAFAAGDYDITVDLNNGVVQLAGGLHPRQHMTWIGFPSEPRSQATMLFAVQGDRYALMSIAAASWKTLPPHKPKNVLEATVLFSR